MMRSIGIIHRDLNDGLVREYIGWTAEAHGKRLVVDMELFVSDVNKTYQRRSLGIGFFCLSHIMCAGWSGKSCGNLSSKRAIVFC